MKTAVFMHHTNKITLLFYYSDISYKKVTNMCCCFWQILWKMATLFTATTTPSNHHLISSSQHPKQNLQSQPLSVSFTENQAHASVALQQQQQMTDWVASPVTRRFGIGVGFAWAGFLAFGAVSEQMKSRLDVFQEDNNIRFELYITVFYFTLLIRTETQH